MKPSRRQVVLGFLCTLLGFCGFKEKAQGSPGADQTKLEEFFPASPLDLGFPCTVTYHYDAHGRLIGETQQG